VNPAASAFCTGCGLRLTASPASEDEDRDGGERRHLTVMFCDLVDSTRLAGELDPEDMRDLVVAYHRMCAAAIAEHSGFVAKYLGDGVLAYFGYPEAHEDDARLAVAASLAIVDAVAALRAGLGREDVDVRVGLHTGEVVIAGTGADDSRQEHDIVGEAPNVAARLQSAATPGSVLISDRTRELVDGYYALESVGRLALKGITRPMHAFRVIGETGARTRLDAVATRGLTPLIGRDDELGELLEHWDDVVRAEGRVVLLSGEPGIGKSRLAHELCGRAAAEGGRTLRLRSSPYNTNSMLFPFVEHLLRRGGGEVADRLDWLEAHLTDLGLDAETAAPLIAELLAIPTGDRYPPSSDSGLRRKRRTLDVLFAWLLAQSAQDSLLLVVEDVQWTDPTTSELLARFFAADPVPHVLVVLTLRTGFVPPWAHRPHVHHIALERLEGAAIQAMVQELTGGKPLPAQLEEQIGARTDGVPLFVEEVTHAVLESGCVEEGREGLVAAATLPERLVPSTLRESLMARLDGLGEARAVAQVLSVVGREAPFELLRAASQLDDTELEVGLDRLVDTDLVRRTHSAGGTCYVLKHWLIQDVAYESLLRSSRRRYHGRIADALPGELPEVVEAQPEFVAHHLVLAGRDRDAIAYLQRACALAHRRSANTEAIEHVTHALELLRRQPESPDRQHLELSLQLALGAPLTAAKGYSAPEVERVYTRAGSLCNGLGDDGTPEFFRALYGTWRVHLLRADYTGALQFGEQLLRLAEASGSATQLAAAHRAVGSTLFYRGDDPVAASGHLERVIASQAFERARMSFIEDLHDVVDPWITCHAYESWALWIGGRPAEARAMSDRALALTRELQHPFTHALALSFDAWLCQWLGDVDAVRERARDALAVAREQGFEFWVGWDEIMLGWAQAVSGDGEAGLATMRRGLEDWRAVGSELGTTYFLALMADAQATAGRLDDAFASLDAADEVAGRTGEGWWAPEVHRLRGELLWRRGAPDDDVESRLRAALGLARLRSARSLSLRVAVTLAEFWFARGRGAEASALLDAELRAHADGGEDAGVRQARALLASAA
jgi:class 3 adenylate cyclase/predicted ATPase